MQNHIKELRTFRKSIGQNIHELRVEKKITLRKLSRLTQINVNKLDQFEMGKNAIGFEEIFLIADNLQIKVTDIVIPAPYLG